jgi:lysophospholipase L1-like esterase
VLEVTLSNDAGGKVAADAVRVTPGGLRIVSPANTDFLTSQDIVVQVSYSGFPTGWDVEFTLDGDSANPLPAQACVPATSNTRCLQLTQLSYDEHIIDAYMIDQNGEPQSFTDRVGFVIGIYYVGFGDSVTRGSQDDIASDDVSTDGRDSGGGYEPILNNLLSNATGFPHTIKNEGVSGNLSSDGVNRIAATLAAHPQANFFLIMFGTNDAKSVPPVSTAVFQNNMQQIIDAVFAAGKVPYLAKIPFLLGSSSTGPQFTDPDNADENMLIIQYNQIIDQLAFDNGVPVTPPDFYNHFRDNYFFDGASQYGDNIHPNGTGYQWMADMWSTAIWP